MVLVGMLWLANICFGQWRWDGGGSDDRWENPANWLPDGVPTAGADVRIDNSLLNVGYTVTLPSGAVTVDLNSLQVTPGPGLAIELVLPRGNTAVPGLRVTGVGDALALEAGALFRNASGAAAGDVVQLTGNFRIANGARYLHQTARGNASLIDRLSGTAGTEFGVFEFDVPGTAGYTVSLTGNTFGTLAFSAETAGGMKSYSGSGTSTLQIRGHWIIRAGASLTSTLSANILLRGNLVVDGNLQLNPTTSGTTGRSIFFMGDAGRVQGNGIISMNAQFRNLEFFSGSAYHLDRNLTLPLSHHRVLVHSGATLHTLGFQIDGAGSFTLDTDGTLGIGSPDGISAAGNTGNIRTAVRQFSTGGQYRYEGGGSQQSGDGLPANVAGLSVDKTSSSLLLSGPVLVTGTLGLYAGKIISADGKMLTITSASIESPGNAYGQPNNGWEGSFVDGPLRWESSEAITQVLPVGRGDVFAPLGINRQRAGTASYTVAYYPQAHAMPGPIAQPPLDRVSRLEYWTIKAEAAGADAEARIALSWRPGSGVGGNAGAEADLRIAQYADQGAGLRWEAIGTNPLVRPAQGYGWIESDEAATDFTDFTLASGSNLNILPLQSIRISGKMRNGIVEISGAAEGSGTCPPLQLEKSPDGRNFQAIGDLKKGISFGEPLAWEDSLPHTGWNHYRLRGAGDSGRWRYSRVISLWSDVLAGMPKLYPNPVQSGFTLYFRGVRSGTPAQIVQMDGRILRTITLVGEIHREDLRNLPAGNYCLVVLQQGKKRVIPFMKR
jgi:hypothetical protein